jgi:hypothetical protein
MDNVEFTLRVGSTRRPPSVFERNLQCELVRKVDTREMSLVTRVQELQGACVGNPRV